jgi:hypothetical protein
MDGQARNEWLLPSCHQRAVLLLKRNATAAGVLAATPGLRAKERSYTAIFGRDAAMCAIGMALSGDAELEREAGAGLITLAEHQAPSGQIPKFVDVEHQEPDFWYVGCIDATLWWLIALACLDLRRTASVQGLRARYQRQVGLALQWLAAQEHPRFCLLQQNEASDWADIMPRAGFVLYTNALWHRVKIIYGLARADETRLNFNSLFHPFSAPVPEYRRARLLNDYVLHRSKDRALYVSFVNLASFGPEGDVFGNILAILCELTDAEAGQRTLRALQQAGVHEPYPVRAVVRPIKRGSALWRPYMARHQQNLVWQYHNGGIWPMIGGFWVAALVACGRREQARAELVKLAQACALNGWAFSEWLHGKTLRCRGMPGQSWNAAAFLMAEHAVGSGRSPLGS